MEIALVLAVVLVALVAVVVGFRIARRGSGIEVEEEIAEPELPAPPLAPPTVEAPTTAAPAVDDVVVEEPVVEEPVVEEPPVRPRLRDRLGRTRAALGDYVRGVRSRDRVDAATWDDVEEMLLLADVGVATTGHLVERMRAHAAEEHLDEPAAVVARLEAEVALLLDDVASRELRFVPGERNVWMFVGVNGVGKTTTIGKLARRQASAGASVLLAAADTFRAAAAEQLTLWAERSGADIVRGQEGADPGSVVFDAMAAAGSRGTDLVLVDTAGRLHTKSNLMEELRKLRRIVDRTEGALKEVLLVLDASTGQNGLAQARQFTEAVDVTGVVLTKLDGTAKGGIVLAIQAELGIPVKLVGVGEGVEDLVAFDAAEFAAALFAEG